MQRIFTKKCILITVDEVVSSSWWQTFRWWRRGWNVGPEVAEKIVKRILCCGFRRTGKAMVKCWLVDMLKNKRLFSGFNIICFTLYIYIHFWPIDWLPLVNLLFFYWNHYSYDSHELSFLEPSAYLAGGYFATMPVTRLCSVEWRNHREWTGRKRSWPTPHGTENDYYQ
jgi:hypothetical protein